MASSLPAGVKTSAIDEVPRHVIAPVRCLKQSKAQLGHTVDRCHPKVVMGQTFCGSVPSAVISTSQAQIPRDAVTDNEVGIPCPATHDETLLLAYQSTSPSNSTVRVHVKTILSSRQVCHSSVTLNDENDEIPLHRRPRHCSWQPDNVPQCDFPETASDHCFVFSNEKYERLPSTCYSL